MAVKASATLALTLIVDIKAVFRYYLLQSSTLAKPSKPTTNPPGGGWTLTEPSYSDGSTNSLYFTDLTVFSDDAFSYADVSLSSSYEAAKAAYNKAVSAADAAGKADQAATKAQTTADGKNTVFYQDDAPAVTGRKANDIWFDTDDGNRMYFFDGKAWTAKQFGTNAMAASSVTANILAAGAVTTAKLAANAVSADQLAANAVTADKIAANAVTSGKIAANAVTAGTIAANAVTTDKLNANAVTAAKLASDSVTTEKLVANAVTGAKIAANTITANNIAANTITGSKIAASTIKAGNIDVSDLFAQNITATGTITGLKLSAATGSFSGSITASSGKIGGYTITSTANTDTTAKGGHCYTVSLYGHSGDGTYEYEVGLKSDASATSGSGNLAFYVKRIAKDAQWSTATNLFYVTHAGKLYAQNAEITGTITTSKLTATGGTIGGFTINASKLTCTATISDVTYTAWLEKNTGATTNYFWGVQVGGASKAYVRYDGYLYANNANITGSITATSLTAKNTYYIHNASGTKKVAMTAPDASFGSSLDIGAGFTAVHISGQVITGGHLTVLEDGSGTVNCSKVSAMSHSVGWIDAIKGNAAVAITAYGTDGGFNALGSVRAKAGGWAIGALNSDSSFRIAYGTNSRISSSTNGTDALYTFGNNGTFSANALSVSGNANLGTITAYDGKNYKPVGTYATDGHRLSCISTRLNSSKYELRVLGQWGTTGSTYAWKTCWSAASSDIRLKENIRKCRVDALSLIEQINLYSFDWKLDKTHQRIGMIADELERLDELLTMGGGTDDDGNMDIKEVDTFYLMGYVVKGLQELLDRVNKLERKAG